MMCSLATLPVPPYGYGIAHVSLFILANIVRVLWREVGHSLQAKRTRFDQWVRLYMTPGIRWNRFPRMTQVFHVRRWW